MSSSTKDSHKQLADGAAGVEEPSSKKVKIDDDATKSDDPKGTPLKLTADLNNATIAAKEDKNSKVVVEANNGKIATKAAVNNINNNNNKSESQPGDANDQDGQQQFDGQDSADDQDGAESGNLDGVFDPKIAKSLEQVENIQSEICNLNEKASEEILKVEQKFNQLRRPFFEKRNELLKGIPNFWLTSLANHPIIAPMIESAEDEDCLHYMVNLDVEEFEDIKSGYKLKFYFVENPYITNSVIEKEFQVVSSEEIISTTTPVEYKNTRQGNSLKNIVATSAQQLKSQANSRRALSMQQPFFAWLVEPSSEGGSDEIADILKDQIWPNPLEYFFQTPEDYAEDDDESDDDESDDEDEEIDEEIEDEEDNVITEGIDFSGGEELDDEEDDDDDDEE